MNNKITINKGEIFKLNDEILQGQKINSNFINNKWKIKTTTLKDVNINKFVRKKINLKLENDSMFQINGKDKYVLLPANIRKDIAENFRLYMINKAGSEEVGNEKIFIQKFELNGVEVLFYKEGLAENGMKKEEVDNEIGKGKDQNIDMNNTMNKSMGR